VGIPIAAKFDDALEDVAPVSGDGLVGCPPLEGFSLDEIPLLAMAVGAVFGEVMKEVEGILMGLF